MFFETLTVPQLLRKFPALWNPEVYYNRYKSPPLVPVLSQINPIHALQNDFILQITGNIFPHSKQEGTEGVVWGVQTPPPQKIKF
jgi:hypothetical protein